MNNWLSIVQYLLARCLPVESKCLFCFQALGQGQCICCVCERHFLRYEAHFPFPSCPVKALFHYKWPVDRLIHKLKFHGQLPIAYYFGAQMGKRLKLERPVDVVIPLPLHPKRQQERGFNQNIEIAKVVARQLNLPLDRRSCTKIKNTKPQSSLNAIHRRHNISAEMFQIGPLKAKKVLVIEDVITTGTTISAFYKALKRSGVETVEIWACCIAQGRSNENEV